MTRRKRPQPLAPQPVPPAYPVMQAPMLPVAYPERDAQPFVYIQTLQSKNASVANVSVSKPPLTWDQPPAWQFKSDGSAKREQGDRFDKETGEMLSVGRALVDAGEQMVREAARRVQASVEQQAAEREKAAERREHKARPVRHRTLKEWEALQARREEVLAKFEAVGVNDETVAAAKSRQWGEEVTEAHIVTANESLAAAANWGNAVDEHGTPYNMGRHAKS